MQEVPAIKTTTSDPFEQLRSAALVDTSSQSRAFADFMGLLGRGGLDKAPAPARAEAPVYVDPALAAAPRVETPLAEPVRVAVDSAGASAPSPLVQGTTVAAVNTQARAAAPATGTDASGTNAAQASEARSTEARLSGAKAVPVSREAFEEMRPILAKAGLGTREIEELAARVQAGALTWGQLVHSVAGQMSGAKKPVELSADQSQQMQALFQKLGFAPDQAKGMVADVAAGDGLKVLSNIQQKLSTLPDSMSLSLDRQELAGLFKALRLPQDTAARFTKLMEGEISVADMKGALAQLGQAMQEHRARGNAQDTETAKALVRIMDKDVAKAVRDQDQTTGQAKADSSSPQLTYEMKAKERADTAWFDQREKRQAKSEDGAWQDFLTRVRAEGEATGQTRAGQSGGRDSLDALGARGGALQNAQQGKAEASQQGRAFDKVAAPRMLDQVQEALLKDLGQGRKQLTLNLDPESLGRLQVMLQVRDKDVHAVLRAEDADTARMLTAQLESIRRTLEDQGLKVQHLEVQTGLAGGNGQQQAQFSADQHNQAQQRQELSRMFSQLRMLRGDGGDVAHEMHNEGVQAIIAERGLHIVA